MQVGTREIIRQGAGVARYNLIFTWSNITHRPGVGSIFLPWGKGLKINQTKHIIETKILLTLSLLKDKS